MAEVVASILADSVPVALHRARRAAFAGADWLELRLDGLPPDTDPRAFLDRVRLPVLACCRTARDGGRYDGPADARRELLQRWVDAGVAGLDLEGWEGWTPNGVERLRLHVRSHHNLTGVGEDLPGIRDQLLQMGAHVAKLAVTAHDLADAAPVLDLLAGTSPATEPTVAFAMGRDAWPTRVLAAVLGAPYVYGAAAGGLETAPGQPPVALLRGLYDVHRIGPATLIYGVVGNPAHHSLGPWLFNRAFHRLAHDAIYLPLTTARPEATLAMLSRRRLRGLSVTAPHKAALIRHCHEIDADTAATGALNTLTFRAHGAVHGHNTDVLGVRTALVEAGVRAPGMRAVVLGGGGAARAAAIALASLELETTIMPRSLDSVRPFAKEHGFQLARLDAGVLAGLRPRVVVHATPVGGPGDEGSRLLPDWDIVPGTFVLDMVYQHKTRLLRDTAAAGGIPIPGLAMYLAQAQEQLYLFAGRRLAIETVRELIGA